MGHDTQNALFKAPLLTPGVSPQVYNTSGHFFMQFDIDTGIMYAEEATIVEDADARVVVGLSAFAPTGFGMADQLNPFYGVSGALSAEVKKMVTYSYMTRTSSLFVNGSNTSREETMHEKHGTLQSLSWGKVTGRENKKPDEPIAQRNNISVGPGLDFVSLEAQQTTIPVAEETYPLYSHIDGGGYINVIGGPFVDAPSMSCKWTIISDHCTRLSSTPREYTQQCLLYSTETVYVNATYIVCITPPVTHAVLAEMTISLSGVVWSFPTGETFVFFTTGNPSGRQPLFGSSKGLNVLKVQGVNTKFLSWEENTNILADSRCEFGEYTDLRTYMTDDEMTFNDATCINITIGPLTEEYCAFTCKSPHIPHEMCLYDGPFRLCPQDAKYTLDKCEHLCTEFIPECPRGSVDLVELQGKCRPLIDLNVNVPLRLGPSARAVSTHALTGAMPYNSVTHAAQTRAISIWIVRATSTFPCA